MQQSSPETTSRQAFGLVETLIAVAILSLVLLVSVTLGSMVLRSMTLRAQTVQATNLARQKLEEVRNIRDNTWLGNRGQNIPWNYWGGPGDGKQVSIGSGTDYTVKYDSDTGYYLNQAISASDGDVSLAYGSDNVKYNCKIHILTAGVGDFTDSNGNKININGSGTNPVTKIYQVESIVSWDSYGGNNSVVLRTYLSDWLPQF
jgi:type II secretory pathway pseudopilin PulG